MTSASHRVRRCDTAADAAEIHRLIYALAVYEKEPGEMTTTVADYERDLNTAFGAALAEVSTDEGCTWKACGVALYFESYSSWKGKCLYLEDLFVEPEFRGKGLGGRLMKYCAEHALEIGCHRMQWVVLDWNKPSRNVYKSMGAKELQQWILVRMDQSDVVKYIERER